MLTVFDIGIVMVLMMYFIVGLHRGVIKEAVSLVGIILVFILSFKLRGKVGNVLCMFMPFFKFTGNMKNMATMNIFLYQAIAFGLVFCVLMGIYSLSLKISKIVQKIVNMTIILWLPSKILGGVVSFLKGYVIIFAVLLVVMIPFGNVDVFKNSRTVNFMLNKTPIISKYAKKYVTPVKEVYDLGVKLAKSDITINEADLESIKIMLKYNVITSKEINKLIKYNKIDEIDGLKQILEEYQE